MHQVGFITHIMDQYNHPFPVLVSYRKALQNLPGNTATSGRLDGDSIAQRSASGTLTQYTLEDIPRLADYSASLYATSPAEYAAYQQYYQQYYRTQISQASIM
jgi:RNA-binding protein 5/10